MAEREALKEYASDKLSQVQEHPKTQMVIQLNLMQTVMLLIQSTATRTTQQIQGSNAMATEISSKIF